MITRNSRVQSQQLILLLWQSYYFQLVHGTYLLLTWTGYKYHSITATASRVMLKEEKEQKNRLGYDEVGDIGMHASWMVCGFK